jgi:hypothetical protein
VKKLATILCWTNFTVTKTAMFMRRDDIAMTKTATFLEWDDLAKWSAGVTKIRDENRKSHFLQGRAGSSRHMTKKQNTA